MHGFSVLALAPLTHMGWLFSVHGWEERRGNSSGVQSGRILLWCGRGAVVGLSANT